MADFVIALLHGALSTSVSATLDVLDFANRFAVERGEPRLTYRVIGSATHVRLSNGMTISAEPFSTDGDLGKATLVIPGLGLDDLANTGELAKDSIGARYDVVTVQTRLAKADARRLARLAAAHHQQGGRVGASCSGVMLLGAAGLLNGRRATTHWRMINVMTRLFPNALPDAARMVIEDGRVITAGAVMAQFDLMLYLLKQALSEEVTDAVSRYLLIDSRTSQSRYIDWGTLTTSDDNTVLKFEALVESSLPDIMSIEEAAAQLSISPKTLSRRIMKATGCPPRQLVQSIRMRHAQWLLQTTNLSTEEIAARVGYANPTSLRKLTLKLAHQTPALLRRYNVNVETEPS